MHDKVILVFTYLHYFYRKREKMCDTFAICIENETAVRQNENFSHWFMEITRN